MRLALFLLLGVLLQEPSRWSATVGMPVSVKDLVLPGSELEAVPAERGAPLVLRVDAVQPHGDRYRYDLVFYALEPGTHDLRSYLRRRDGSGIESLPPLELEVATLLPPGQVEPHRPEAGRLPRFGGYRTLLWVLGVLWVAGLVVLLRSRRKARALATSAGGHAVPLEEQLRPLVAAARAGALEPAGRAELERALIAWWRRKLDLEETDAAVALTQLAAHPEAGPLLAGLEQWLHRPDSPEVDLERLLAPYEHLQSARATPDLAVEAR